MTSYPIIEKKLHLVLDWIKSKQSPLGFLLLHAKPRTRKL